MKKNFVLLTLLILSFSLKGQQAANVAKDKELQSGFKHPPISDRPRVYWWWLNGDDDTVRLKQESISIKNAGLGGSIFLKSVCLSVPNRRATPLQSNFS